MAKAGDSYTIRLKETYLAWGEYRKTDSRGVVQGEGYIPIPKEYAQQYNVYNSNHIPSGLGLNIFIASSVDGFLQNVRLLAQGCSTAGDEYAKQFSVQGDLQRIGQWYKNQKATVNNSVKVTWLSATEIQLEIL